tara:strand:- start:514 stop:1344 length:831 start_codon:yes stop_codon:yes gene_type:complete
LKYTKILKTGFPVVDTIIKNNMELVETFVERAEADEKRQIDALAKEGRAAAFRPWGEWEKQGCAMGCIMDLTKALAKIVTTEDKLLNADLKVRDGLLQGTGAVKRGTKKINFEATSIYAGGYNIQRFHIRFLIKSDLPKIKVPKDVNKVLERTRGILGGIKGKEKQILRLEKQLVEYTEDFKRYQKHTREGNDARITKGETESFKLGYGDLGIYNNGNQVMYDTFEEYIGPRCDQAWEAVKEGIVHFKGCAKRTKGFIKDAKANLKQLKQDLKEVK